MLALSLPLRKPALTSVVKYGNEDPPMTDIAVGRPSSVDGLRMAGIIYVLFRFARSHGGRSVDGGTSAAVASPGTGIPPRPTGGPHSRSPAPPGETAARDGSAGPTWRSDRGDGDRFFSSNANAAGITGAGLDPAFLRHLVQDCTGMKTLLLKLKRALQEVRSESGVGSGRKRASVVELGKRVDSSVNEPGVIAVAADRLRPPPPNHPAHPSGLNLSCTVPMPQPVPPFVTCSGGRGGGAAGVFGKPTGFSGCQLLMKEAVRIEHTAGKFASPWDSLKSECDVVPPTTLVEDEELVSGSRTQTSLNCQSEGQEKTHDKDAATDEVTRLRGQLRAKEEENARLKAELVSVAMAPP
ncbi:unnamed protein product [Lampetra fluviatilis]